MRDFKNVWFLLRSTVLIKSRALSGVHLIRHTDLLNKTHRAHGIVSVYFNLLAFSTFCGLLYFDEVFLVFSVCF